MKTILPGKLLVQQDNSCSATKSCDPHVAFSSQGLVCS